MAKTGRPKNIKIINKVIQLKAQKVKNADIARVINKSLQLTQYYINKYVDN